MHRFDRGLRDAWSLAISYWQSEERWRARILLGAIISLNLILVGTTLLFTYWQGAFYNALGAKDWNGFLGSLFWWHRTPKDGFTLGFAPVLVIFVLATAYELYLRQALQIRWRRWMTDIYVGEWLSDSAYFRMALSDSGTDNPDQRIAEDIRLFVDNTLTLGLGLIRSAVSLALFVSLLWSLSGPLVVLGLNIHGYLVWIALLYATVGTWFAHVAGRELTPLHFVQQKAEADFRFSLMRLLENVEAIAFNRGEAEQEDELDQRFVSVVANWRAIMIVTKRLTFFTTGYAQIVLVFPLAVISPAYFAGRITLGGIFEASNAFVHVQDALSWVVQSYSDLTSWLATVERLSSFRRSIMTMRSTSGGPTIITSDSNALEVSGLNLELPSGRGLLWGVEIRLEKGERLLINGDSGAGKSTLLRAIAGIWPFGSGTIRRPPGTQLFMPQRPYMPLGSLKHAVCYPLSEDRFSDLEVVTALNDVSLGHLTSDLMMIDSWERRLSGGEQQRLTFARALLIQPDWLFLDESTSALDAAAEEQVYALILRRLPNATLMSIAHKREVAKFHTRTIWIKDGAVHYQISPES